MLPVSSQRPVIQSAPGSQEIQTECDLDILSSDLPEGKGEELDLIERQFGKNQQDLMLKRNEIDSVLADMTRKPDGVREDTSQLNPDLNHQPSINLLRGDDLETLNARDFFRNLCVILFRNLKHIFYSLKKE